VTTLLDILLSFWLVTVQMAPWLLLGFLVAGLLSVYVSPRWLERHLGGGGLKPVAKAALFGMPLPLCSCGVIPVGASLRRQGASPAATTAFLISTPQTGVDSIAVTGALLGPVFAVIRPLIALVTGLLGGVLVQAFGGRPSPTAAPFQAAATVSTGQRLAQALRYGFETLPRDIGRPLLLGLAAAALITALVPAGALSGLLGGGLLPILVMMAVSVPVYFCATGSVPLVAGFIHAGVSPGAALTLLIAGPTTNAAMLALLFKILGRRAGLIYLATVAGSAVICGLVLDALYRELGWSLTVLHTPHHHAAVSWLGHLWAGLLVVNLGWVFWPRRRSVRRDAGAETVALQVEGMNCGHCRQTVTAALGAQPGVQRVTVDLSRGRAVIHGHGLDPAALAAAVGAAGFTATAAGAH
jgi:uncharacterized protein